ncbi:helix-turn-helix domain-containing protein [Dokdonia sp. Asnod2-E02]|uniref:helix-turn-helix domain-containing protein n=1 Tax=Dokdonia sp. Asnod2-E02 TaxID=3160574 RepID=UPI00386585C5
MESIQEQLKRIENLLKSQTLLKKEILTVKEASIYLGQSTSSIYKLTGKNEIPFYVPNGKMIYFKKKELDEWLLKNRVCSL